MSAESPRHARYGPPLVVPSQPPSERSIIDALSGFINDVTLNSSSSTDPKDVIQWARFETADVNEPVPEGEGDNDVSPLLLILGYGTGVQVWLIPPNGEAQEVLSWRQGTVRVLRILPTPQHGDCFTSKRPLIALCDSASPGPTFCSLSFISIRGGEQVKSIKFKNPILDVLANKRSIVVSFSERFAVFDAATLEDRMTITTCYPCPCPLGGNSIMNPLALGDRWLAYADKKLNPSKRSSGGCEGEGVVSVTASVLHAAKSLSKGLRGLGESVANSLAGTRSTSQSPSPPNADLPTPGVVTIVDMEGLEEEEAQDGEPYDPLVAHFVAHSEALIALKFDNSGMLLVTADRRGHDFHVFRINPHPCGSNLASVHHLYVLHRGDTTAKVQDIAISGDSRWAAISTLRGTTHVFAISPYGGNIGVRTHSQARVVNRLSRFHRSAGLPIPSLDQAAAEAVTAGAWYPNPRAPPHPAPVLLLPLAQLRPSPLPTNTITRTSAGRQRLSSLSEDSNLAPLLVRATFTPVGPVANITSSGNRSGPVISLYLMSASGSLTHLLLHPKANKNVPKEKICDDSPIELEVEPVAQWALHRSTSSSEVVAPLPPSNPLLPPIARPRCADISMSEEERWLSQVEIVTHAGPHRRLWMGPQFVFKTYNFTGSNSSLSEAETVEIDTSGLGIARSNPVNMPCVRPIVPILIDSGSASSLEHSPSDSFRRKSLLAETGRTASVCDVQLKEDLAEAMKEDHGRGGGGQRCVGAGAGGTGAGRVSRCVDPLGTVVGAGRSPPRSPADAADADDYTLDNADEGTFRPVVRAPAPLLPAHMLVRPLPLTTVIPVQTVAPLATHSPDDPAPLHTDVVIPVQCLHPPANPPTNTPTHTDLKRDECQSLDNERANERSLPKLNRPSDDIQPNRSRSKKSPTPKSISDDSDVSFRKETLMMSKAEAVEATDIKKESADSKNRPRKDNKKLAEKLENKKEKKCEEPKVIDSLDDKKESNKKYIEVKGCKKDNECKVEQVEAKQGSVKSNESFEEVPLERKDSNVNSEDVNSSRPVPSKKQQLESMSSESYEEIKTEEQAWHMLLNDSQKGLHGDQSAIGDKESDDSKSKSKRNKMKKAQETFHSKSDEDSFVEIHAIEDKHTPSSDLVSISSPLEDNRADSECSTFEKGKKLRSPKSLTPDKNIKSESLYKNNDEQIRYMESNISNESKKRNSEEFRFDVPTISETTVSLKPKSYNRKKINYNMIQSEIVSEKSSMSEIGKPKSKSMSPQIDMCQASDERKDVYVIDTTEMDFPEIQVTKGFKSQKRSPQPTPRQSQEKESASDKPIKSWSTIAAFKKIDLLVSPFGSENKTFESNDEPKKENATTDEAKGLDTDVSLQVKLSEICKRTDIIVAECGEPSELNFIDEHHMMLQDLPPLEPLDFGLDDFKLEVMRDSLLEVDDRKITSPICKINIDEILSSLKETTKVPESSSAFNLIDLERVAEKKESGFSVIEHDKIMSQEVKADDERNKLYEKEEAMEKSSDDDNMSPVVSTDSDKEDKRNNGASKTVLPLLKQSAKSKKSRRKKK